MPENVSFLEDMTLNDKLIAVGYLDFFTYIFFFVSLFFFFIFFFIKTPPFDNVLVKRITLLLVSLIWFLLFFKLYFYIAILIWSTMLIALWKVRDEIQQYFLIKNYNKKEIWIEIDNWDFETNLMMWEDDWDIYNKIWLVQFFNQLFSLFAWIKTILHEKNESFFAILFLIYVFSIITLTGFIYLFFELFKTEYLFISN